MSEPDWDEAYERLLARTREAIARFSKEYPNAIICDFWYDSEPRYGYVLIGLNTPESARRSVEEQYAYNVAYRRKLLTEGVDTWLDSAYYQLRCHSVREVMTNSADFEFTEYAEILFPDWQEFAEGDQYPSQPEKRPHWLDDYLESRVSYLFWRVFESLVSEDAFSELNLASPTRLGFAFHDGPELVLHLVNWPNRDTEVGTGQPATRPESKPQGGDRTQPEVEGAPGSGMPAL